MRHAVPFRPFTIQLDDGRKLEVPHPDFMVLHPKGTSLVLVDPKGGYDIIGIRHVVGARSEADLSEDSE